MHPRSCRGFTLVELMVGLTVAAILLSAVLPSFAALLNRMRLTGVANELATDLQYSRTEAVRLRANVGLTPAADGSGYRLVGPDTDGDGTPDTLKTVAFDGGITLTADGALVFDQLRATSGAVALDLSNRAGVLRVRTNLMGRVSICVASGAIAEYPAC